MTERLALFAKACHQSNSNSRGGERLQSNAVKCVIQGDLENWGNFCSQSPSFNQLYSSLKKSPAFGIVVFCSYPVLHFLAVISDKAHAPPRSSCGHSVPVAVQLLSRVLLSVTPWTAARQAPLSSSISQSLLRFTSVVSVTLSNHLILSQIGRAHV